MRKIAQTTEQPAGGSPPTLGPEKAALVATLQTDILRLEGFKTVNNAAVDVGLGPLKAAFPNASFPLGCLHEFLYTTPAEQAATCGFMGSLLGPLLGTRGILLWVSAHRTLFPPALRHFGLAPDRVIFIDIKKTKDLPWVMEEALKCSAITAVVAEMQTLDFTTSRRLQLAAEHSRVTGFVLRQARQQPGTTACVSRWQITPQPSAVVDNLPGIGYPQWQVDLLRIRNGKPGRWTVTWAAGALQYPHHAHTLPLQATHQQTG